MAIKTNTPPPLEIPPEKAAIIERAREYEADGWSALQDMSAAELEAFREEVDGAYVWQPGAHGSAARNVPIHPHNQMRLDTLTAITAEKSRRYQEFAERTRQTSARADSINEAAEGARKAVELLEYALKLDKGIPDEVPEPPALDVASATDGELKGTAAACRGIISERDNRNEAPHERLERQAEAISTIKSKAARMVSAELMERAGKYADRLEAARVLLADIEAEQERRERERAEAADRQTPEFMERRIAELEKQMADRLEAAGPLPI